MALAVLAGGLTLVWVQPRSADKVPAPRVPREVTLVGYRGWSGTAHHRTVHFDPGQPLAVRVAGPITAPPSAVLVGDDGARRPLSLQPSAVEGGTVWRWEPGRVEQWQRGTLVVELDGALRAAWPAELRPDVASVARAEVLDGESPDEPAARRAVARWPEERAGAFGRALADLHAGSALFVAGRAEAEAWFDRVAADTEDAELGTPCSYAHNGRAEIAWRRGDFDAVMTRIAQAHGCRPPEDTISEIHLRLLEAHVLAATHRLPTAIAVARAEVERTRTMGLIKLTGRAEAVLAELLTQTGRADLAFGLLARDLSADPGGRPIAEVNAGWTLVEAIEQGVIEDDWARAEALFDHARRALVASSQQRFVDNATVNLAYVLSRRGRPDAARALLDQMAPGVDTRPDVLGLARVTRAQIALESREPSRALELVDEAPTPAELGGTRITWRLVRIAAEAEVALGRPERAERRLREAMERSEEDGVPVGTEPVAQRLLRDLLTDLLLRRGHVGSAFDVIAEGHRRRLRGLRLAAALQRAPAELQSQWGGFVEHALERQRLLAELDATCDPRHAPCRVRRAEILEASQTQLQAWLRRLDLESPPLWRPDPRDVVVTASGHLQHGARLLWRRRETTHVGDLETLLVDLMGRPPQHVYWLGPPGHGTNADALASIASWALRSPAGTTLSILPALEGPRPPPPHSRNAAVLVLADPSEDLPRAREEAARVAAKVQNAQVRVGRDADWAAVQSDWRGAAGLHFAGHARFVEAALAAPHLELAAKGRIGPLEVLLLGSPFSLVVLSGCDTAGNELDGSGALPTAFWAGGAHAVLAVRGPVEDEAALELMTTFYDAGGAAAPMQALRTALKDHPEMASRVLAWGHPSPRREGE